MKEIQRYESWPENPCATNGMVEDRCGGWVKHADYVADRTVLLDIIKHLRGSICCVGPCKYCSKARALLAGQKETEDA